jgi:ribonuclease HI
MELLAAIQGLAAIRAGARLKEGSAVTVYSDSNYLVRGMISWLANWKLNGWRTATGAPVKNADLWRKLDLAAAQHHVAWQWVEGHSGDECNVAIRRRPQSRRLS